MLISIAPPKKVILPSAHRDAIELRHIRLSLAPISESRIVKAESLSTYSELMQKFRTKRYKQCGLAALILFSLGFIAFVICLVIFGIPATVNIVDAFNNLGHTIISSARAIQQSTASIVHSLLNYENQLFANFTLPTTH